MQTNDDVLDRYLLAETLCSGDLRTSGIVVSAQPYPAGGGHRADGFTQPQQLADIELFSPRLSAQRQLSQDGVDHRPCPTRACRR